MLTWLVDRLSAADESPGSLGSLKGARALLAELAAETPQYAVNELGRQLKDAAPAVFALPGGASALQVIDEWAQQPLAELWGSVIADSQGITVTTAVWEVLAQYYRGTYANYWNCHRALEGSAAASRRDPAKATLIAARALAAAARYMLLLRMRYLNAPAETWSHAWDLIGTADERGVSAQPLALYSDGPATTLERELLTAMLIEVAPTGSLLPSQLLALDRLLRLHADAFRRSTAYDAGATPFAYDPSRDAPPQRWLEGLQMRAGLRFFGAGGAYARLSGTPAERDRPADLGRARCSAESYDKLIRRVIAEWSLTPPRRRHPREVCQGEILVVHDWELMRRLVKFSEMALSGRSPAYEDNYAYKMSGVLAAAGETDGKAHGAKSVSARQALTNLALFEKLSDCAPTEAWSLNDTSESGLGATAETDCPWVKIGMVIAFRHRDSAEWKIALVRRLERSPNGRLRIGMSRAGAAACAARLCPGIGRVHYGAAASRKEPEIEYGALLLKDAALTLLLPVGLFDATQKYTLCCEDRYQVVKMERVLERGPNFEQIEISQVQMQRAA